MAREIMFKSSVQQQLLQQSTTDSSSSSRQERRQQRLRELICYKAPFKFVIPARTGLLITTNNDPDNFLAFLVGNEDEHENIHVGEGTSLSDLLAMADFSRCPQIVYNRIKKENNAYGDLDWLIIYLFLENCSPLMKDDCHDMDEDDPYCEDYDNNYNNPEYEFFEFPRREFPSFKGTYIYC